MYKTVLKDHFYNFKGAIRNLSFQDYFIYLYILIILPLGTNMRLGDLEIISCFCSVIFALFLSRMYGGQMSKTFFLCPLSAKQRQEYMIAGIHLRIAFPILFFTIMHAILFISQNVSTLVFFARFIVIVCACISFNIYCQPTYHHANLSERKYPLKGNYEFWNSLSQTLYVLTIFILCALEGNEKLWELIIIAILVIISVLTCFKMVKTFYPQLINHVTFYENRDNQKQS